MIEDFFGIPEDPGSIPVIHIVILIIGIVIYMTLVVQWAQRALRNRMSDNATILERYLARTSQSEVLARSARTVIPGGIVTDTRFFEPYGIYVERAAGVHKWDVDGNDYLDFFGGHGANILGHSHPVLVEAVTRAIQRGVQFAANQPLEVALAAEVLRHFPSAQQLATPPPVLKRRCSCASRGLSPVGRRSCASRVTTTGGMITPPPATLRSLTEAPSTWSFAGDRRTDDSLATERPDGA